MEGRSEVTTNVEVPYHTITRHHNSEPNDFSLTFTVRVNYTPPVDSSSKYCGVKNTNYEAHYVTFSIPLLLSPSKMNERQTYLRTPWCRTLFERPIVTQLVKKISPSYGTRRFITVFTKDPPLDPLMSQPNPVRPIDPHLSKVHLNVILSPTPRSFQWSLAFRPPNQNHVNTSPLPHVCHMSHPPHPP